ncbi:uncharacterized protein LOC130692229 [Daphnia carinata]|uniref:uncharacterized protein LOC130692229 n=1 Tax=Daphnia carinata TaxID=120202 RepID=UPI00286870B5|nr:uncharacterized protein LOC130692229 [Daphnia carinata]
MRFFVFFLSVLVAIIQGNAQYQAYYRDALYPYPYPDHQVPVIPSPDQENRIFFNQIFNAITSFYTSTTTTTSTSTTTCTVSTNFVCPGRRKRFIVGEHDDVIEPSLVNEVETTQAADMETLVRTERKADPQFLFWRVDSEYPGYELQSTFGPGPYPANYYPYMRPPVVAADSRLFILRVTTVTSSTTTTSRSTPGCSSASNFNQC